LVLSGPVCAQLSPIQLDPSVVNSKAKKITGEHLAYETPLQRNGKLLVTVGGTGSQPSNFRALQQFATTLGYDVVALDYPNAVTTIQCRLTKDLQCFDHFHEEIVQGKEVSDLCAVDVSNSLEQRLNDVLKHLSATKRRWREYYSQGQLQWSKLVLVGHSQGSGHVAFMGKQHKVDRVFLIAGPQDSFDPLPAPWLLEASATANDRYFALLHKDDFYKVNLQLSAFAALIGSVSPMQSQQVIVSDRPVKDAHNELIQKHFVSEWEIFLKAR
jgi:pimeloyl-ACP methyl ester carboxylesterase